MFIPANFTYHPSYFDDKLVEYKNSQFREVPKNKSNYAIINFITKLFRYLFNSASHLQNVVTGLELEASRLSDKIDDILKYIQYVSLFKTCVIDKHNTKPGFFKSQINTQALEQALKQTITEENFNTLLARALTLRLPALVRICQDLKPQYPENLFHSDEEFNDLSTSFQNNEWTSEDYDFMIQIAEGFSWKNSQQIYFEKLLETVSSYEISKATPSCTSSQNLNETEIQNRKNVLQKHSHLLTKYQGGLAPNFITFFCSTFSNLKTFEWTPISLFNQSFTEDIAKQFRSLSKLEEFTLKKSKLPLEALKCLDQPSLRTINGCTVLLKTAELNNTIGLVFDPSKKYNLKSNEIASFKSELIKALEPLPIQSIEIRSISIDNEKIAGDISFSFKK